MATFVALCSCSAKILRIEGNVVVEGVVIRGRLIAIPPAVEKSAIGTSEFGLPHQSAVS